MLVISSLASYSDPSFTDFNPQSNSKIRSIDYRFSQQKFFPQNPKTAIWYSDHSPLYIDGNLNFSTTADSENWPGDGTLIDPYLITDFSFESSSSSLNLIEIRNTDVYFEISGCRISGGYHSVYLHNVTNGNISYCEINDGYYGISTMSSNNNTIHNNTISNTDTYGIYLSSSENTTVYFNKILNNKQGIYLSNSDFANISHNLLSSNSDNGIYFSSSGFGSSCNNVIHGNGDGIYLSSSNGVIIHNNTIYDNGETGIYLHSSGSCSITNNSIFNNVNIGIYFYYSGGNTIINNTLVKNGISLYGMGLSNFLQTTVNSNSVNGKPLIFWQNKNSDNITTIEAGQVILVNCTFIEISNQTLSEASVGMLTAFSTNLTIHNNTIKFNKVHGIYSKSSINNTLFNNTILGSEYGIYLFYSGWNNFSKNIFANSTNYGLYIRDSENNSLKSNKFIMTGLYVTGIELYHYYQFILAENSVNSKNLIYKTDEKDKIISEESGQIILVNCSSFEIVDQSISNTTVGILAAYSSDIQISNNTLDNNTQFGIYLTYTNHSRLEDNNVTKCLFGIDSYLSNNNTIHNNTISDSRKNGLSVSYSDNNTITFNRISNNLEDGLSVWGATNNTISNNSISNNHEHGISSWYSDNNTYSGNIIFKNQEDGVYIRDSLNTTFLSNLIAWNYYGLYILSLNNCNISRNAIAHNKNYGIHLNLVDSANISRNDFIKNNVYGSYQAYDSKNNNFTLNYWEDWVESGIDSNGDGIFDDPYPVAGSSNNNDAHPVASPLYFKEPSLLFPVGGEILNKSVLIQWKVSQDAWGQIITYSLDYSPDNGSTWTNLISGLTSTNYNWNLTLVENGVNYLVRVTANCSRGILIDAESETTFTILNHQLTSPFILYPNGGEILTGKITIDWETSDDSWDHNITYSVYYSPNNGIDWFLIAMNLNESNYAWETNLYSNLATYTIRVVSRCSDELIMEDSSDGPFSISNPTPTTVTPTTTTPVTTNPVTTISSSSQPTSETIITTSPGSTREQSSITTSTPSITFGWVWMLVLPSIMIYTLVKRIKRN